jgi:hypothetical protein
MLGYPDDKSSVTHGFVSNVPSYLLEKGTPAWHGALMREGLAKKAPPSTPAPTRSQGPVASAPQLSHIDVLVPTPSHGIFYCDRPRSKWPKIFHSYWWREDTLLAHCETIGDVMAEKRWAKTLGAVLVALLTVYIVAAHPETISGIHTPLANMAGNAGANWIILGCGAIVGYFLTLVVGKAFVVGVRVTSLSLAWGLRAALVGGLAYGALAFAVNVGWVPHMINRWGI